MVGDVAIEMGSLISVGMMGLRKAGSVGSRNRPIPRMWHSLWGIVTGD